MSKLRFSVAAYSSEDAVFRACELNKQAEITKGYMTDKNCPYPQDLVLQLQDGLCRVSQMQLLSHQSHIATKIELFVSKEQSYERDTTRFTRLGFLTLKTNIENKYKARELKTVLIEQEAILLKLRIHTCHINERNLYNQVGFITINLYGQPLGLLPCHSRSKSVSNMPRRKIEEPEHFSLDVRFDLKTAAKLRDIQVAKDEAVANEDYDQAKRLKQVEEHVQSIGLELTRLDAQKKEAVVSENYDLAKKIKHEISMLEGSLSSNETQPIVPNSGTAVAPSRIQSHRLSSTFFPCGMHPDNLAPVADNGGDDGGRKDLLHQSIGEEHDETSGAYHTGPYHGKHSELNSYFRGIPDAEDLPAPEEISPAFAKDSEELVAVIGPFFTRCVFSNLWKHRVAAIRKVTMDMKLYDVDSTRLLDVCSRLAQIGVQDCIAQVTLSAFELLDRMLSFSARVHPDDMCRIVSSFSSSLFVLY